MSFTDRNDRDNDAQIDSRLDDVDANLADATATARRWRIIQAFDDAEIRAARERDDETEAAIDAMGRFWLCDETISRDAYLWTRDGVAEVRR